MDLELARPAPSPGPSPETEAPALAPAGRALQDSRDGGTAPDAAPADRTIGTLVDGAYDLAGRDDAPAELTGLLDRALAARAEIAGREPDPPSVDRAVGTITERLDSSFTNPVTHGDLVAVQRTVEGLSPAEATRTFERLPDGLLDEWSDQMNDRIGGYGRAEKSALFGALAERLDGAQLARFADALSSPPSGADGQRLGLQIASQAPAAVRVGFVREAAPLAGVDPEATLALGEALGGLRGPDIDRALGTLSPDQLRSVVDGSVVTERYTAAMGGGGHLTIMHDAGTLGRLLDGLATSRDPSAKALAIGEAVERLEEIETRSGIGYAVSSGDGPSEVRDGITAVLRSDAGGVVRALEQDADPYGLAFTGYVKSMIQDGRSGDVGRLLVDLGTDGGTRAPSDWVTERAPGDHNGDTYYENAQTLGYAVGSVQAAIESITSDRRDQADAVKSIFGATVGVAGAAHPAGGAVGSVLTGLGNEAVDAVVDRYTSQDQTLSSTLRDLAFPRNPDGSRYNGPAETPHGEAALRVVSEHRGRR